ncbi:MAG: biotin carboxylase N-terminal domain-containing protein [Actinomycetota bacterium]
MTIRRLLVANRGEIARRVIRSAHDMGIDTVAVFADGDAGAPFVREAGQAVALRGQTPAETYLDVDKVLHAASVTGADAVHAGYGFLAENADFARAVEAAGMTWVGPPPDAIASMGDKLAAKAMMIDADVPTLPQALVEDGGGAPDVGELGMPVLVKASAGGGGKGMRVVESADDLLAAVEGAQREAASSFGDGTVFIERYLPAPRHVEIQVLGDQHGTVVHLFERECSIQRRHQKIIEEAPSPALTAALRDRMGAAAVAAARAVGYYSAGTVEFLVDGEGDDAEFFFLEMNTRIQVEHPVTEEITGVDLVREQLRVAMGEPLGYGQDDLAIDGHSIEARLYAEDPNNDFLPAIGTLDAFALPASPDARLDTGVEAGSEVGVEFDPMLAKVIVHAPTRTEAAGRLALVLERMALAGVTTNRDFLVATLRTPEFLAGDTTTDFIDRVDPPRVVEADADAVAEAAMVATLVAQAENRSAAGALSFLGSGWRNSSMPAEQRIYAHGDGELTVHYRPIRFGDGFEMWVGDGRVRDGYVYWGNPTVAASSEVTVELDGLRRPFAVTRRADHWVVQGPRGAVSLTDVPRFPDYGLVEVAGGQTAPMPGKVLIVHVAEGDQVTAGQPLVVMEAMKMEHTISAPVDAVVSELRCAVGDQVDNGQVLIVLDDGSGEG